jgi:MFS transporter, MHS family, proline/betaine transporter
MLLGSGVAALLSTMLGPEQMDGWGWRIPFLLGGSVAPVGLYIRGRIGETPVFLKARGAEEEKSEKWPLFLMASKAFGFTMLRTVSYYLMLTYLPTFTQDFAGLTQARALWSNTIGLLVLVIVTPIMGHLSDRLGRKPLLLASGISFMILPYPFFIYMTTDAHLKSVICIQAIFGLMIALFSGPGPAAIAEIFPTRARLTWMSAGYILATTIFGGFAPYIATALIGLTRSPLAPTYYLVTAAAITTLVILFLPETSDQELK